MLVAFSLDREVEEGSPFIALSFVLRPEDEAALRMAARCAVGAAAAAFPSMGANDLREGRIGILRRAGRRTPAGSSPRVQ